MIFAIQFTSNEALNCFALQDFFKRVLYLLPHYYNSCEGFRHCRWTWKSRITQTKPLNAGYNLLDYCTDENTQHRLIRCTFY